MVKAAISKNTATKKTPGEEEPAEAGDGPMEEEGEEEQKEEDDEAPTKS